MTTYLAHPVPTPKRSDSSSRSAAKAEGGPSEMVAAVEKIVSGISAYPDGYEADAGDLIRTMFAYVDRAVAIEALQEAFDNGADDDGAWDAAIAAALDAALPPTPEEGSGLRDASAQQAGEASPGDA